MRMRGIELGDMVARMITADDFTRFDEILVADRQVLLDLRQKEPAGATARIRLLTEYGPEGTRPDILDPYFTGRFEPVVEVVETCVKGWLERQGALQ